MAERLVTIRSYDSPEQAAECVLPRLRDREWAQVDDILFLEENHYNVTESYIETTYTFERDGTAPTRKGVHRVCTVREIRLFTKEVGFEMRDLLLSLEREPFEVGSPWRRRPRRGREHDCESLARGRPA